MTSHCGRPGDPVPVFVTYEMTSTVVRSAWVLSANPSSPNDLIVDLARGLGVSPDEVTIIAADPSSHPDSDTTT